MLADFSCDTNLPFDAVCRAISAHDPTHVAGPITERLIDSLGLFLIIYVVGRVVRRVCDAAATRGVADRQVRTLIHNVVMVVTYVAATLSANQAFFGGGTWVRPTFHRLRATSAAITLGSCALWSSQ